MADYIITFPNGNSHTIPSGTIDNTYDIPLVGQDAINYGDDFATAAIRLLSNFASDTTPPSFGTNRVEGQLWYDTNVVTGGLKVYDGNNWDTIALASGVVTTSGNQSIADTKTFTSAPAFTASGEPFTVNSTTTVSNLSASLLDGLPSTAFATADQGSKADAAEVNIGNPPVDGYIYTSTAAGTRTWEPPSVGGGGIDPDDVTSAPDPTATLVLLAGHPTDPGQTPYTDGNLTWDGSGNILSCPNFVGNLTGNATSATSATTASTASVATSVTITDEASETTAHPLFVNTATGNQAVHSSDGISYNADSEVLTVIGGFTGPGSNITQINANNISSGLLVQGRGGTGVTTATGSGSSFVLHNSPTFVTQITVPVINNASGVVLRYNGSSAIGSQDRTVSGNTSAAFVFDAGGTNRDVGFNQMGTTTFSSSTGVTLFDRDSAGHSYRSTHTTGEKIYQSEPSISDSDIPDGSMWIVRNFTSGTGTVKIQGGTSSTVRHYNGSGTIVSTSGSTNPFFLARGGVATIVKVADGEYEMWGIGLTGGA